MGTGHRHGQRPSAVQNGGARGEVGHAVKESDVVDELLLPVGEGTVEAGRRGGGAHRIFHQGARRVIDKRVRVAPAGRLRERRVCAQVLEPAAGGESARLVLRAPLQAGRELEPGFPVPQVGGLGQRGHRQERRGESCHRARVGVPLPHQAARCRNEVESVEGHSLLTFLLRVGRAEGRTTGAGARRALH